MGNRFLTLFPNAQNIHLVKDVGMIPYHLYKEFNYCSGISSFENGDYPYLDSEVKGLKQYFIKRIFKNERLNVCWFIFFNFRKWDILQCYHISKESIFYLYLFKFLKTLFFLPSITYLKLDSNDSIKNLNISKLTLLLIKYIDIVSVESNSLCNFFNKTYFNFNKVNYIPNGFKKDSLLNVDFNNKKNLFITVGRIGSFEKNNKILLEAFIEFSKLNDSWCLELVGPIENSFNDYIQFYFRQNPQLKERVFFSGNIENRNDLQSKVNNAKVFILTSYMEGFPLVYLEALRSGCSIISPKFSSAIDVTDNGRYGVLFEVNDYSNLSIIMHNLSSDNSYLKNNCDLIQKYANENFTWSKICFDINVLINKSLLNT